MPGPSSGCFVMTKSVCQHKIVIKGGTLQKSESSLLCFVIAEGSANALLVFIKHPCSLLNSSLLAQEECPSSVSDQWHLVAGHRILNFVVIIDWRWGVHLYYSGVERNCPLADSDKPAEDWAASHECSRCPCEQEIQRHARVNFFLFHWGKPCLLPLLLFHQFHFFMHCMIVWLSMVW